MKPLAAMLLGMLLLAPPLTAHSASRNASPNPSQSPAPGKAADDYSGMYTFLKEGEFVQLTVEDQGHVTGFISRYGDTESDHGAFLDQFFKDAKLEGNKLTFTTKTVHGVWYEFKGTVERGEGKNPGDESYYVLKGTLIQNTDASGKTPAKSRDVVFKAFPQDLGGDSSKP